MKNSLWFMKSSTNELTNVSIMSVADMLVAVSVMLLFLNVVTSSVLEICFAFLQVRLSWLRSTGKVDADAVNCTG